MTALLSWVARTAIREYGGSPENAAWPPPDCRFPFVRDDPIEHAGYGIRGQVIPVVNLWAKFGMATTEVTDETCIIVEDPAFQCGHCWRTADDAANLCVPFPI